MIRDVGLGLAMGDTPLSVMAANLGKVGSNQNGGWDDAGGRDLHVGAWHVGVLPPTAPLPIASATMTALHLPHGGRIWIDSILLVLERVHPAVENFGNH